jgi:hypothetical protein
MTYTQQQPPVENVVAGSILALVIIPVGAALIAVISNIGFFASFVSFLFALGAVALYRIGSGGVISRTGAWIITAIVVATTLLGIWLSLVVGFAGGLGKLSNIGLDGFWPEFNADLPKILNQELIFLVLTVLFAAFGSFRTLRNAFRTAHVTRRPDYFPKVQPSESGTIGHTVYQNDVDAPPTGSADDKTLPPTAN